MFPRKKCTELNNRRKSWKFYFSGFYGQELFNTLLVRYFCPNHANFLLLKNATSLDIFNDHVTYRKQEYFKDSLI